MTEPKKRTVKRTASKETSEDMIVTTDPLPEKETAEQSQFPSLRGLQNLEVEKRGADNDGSEDGRWRKTYVLLGDLESLEDEENEVHRKNRIDVLQQAIMNGLHPQEEASFDGAEIHEDGVSVNLHYSVNVIPSIVDEDPESAVTPADVLEKEENEPASASA